MQVISIIMSLTVLLDEAEYHLKNYADQGGLSHRYLHNSSGDMKVEFNN